MRRADRHHPDQGAGEGDNIAQGDRDDIADDALDHGHVGGHARQNFAGAHLDEMPKVKTEHMAKHGLSHVGDDAFAQFIKKIQPKACRHGENPGHRATPGEDRHQSLAAVHGETAIDHLPGALGDDQESDRRDQQEGEAQNGVDQVLAHERQQPHEGAKITALFRFPGVREDLVLHQGAEAWVHRLGCRLAQVRTHPIRP